jgi:1,4-alpha-glucan branching enzyme
MATALGLVLAAAVAIIMMKQMTPPGAGRSDGGSAGTAAMVRLTLVAPAARQVSVAGDFNKWQTTTHVMQRENGMWTIEIPLQPGRYSYMFVVDGSMWITDPHAESYSDDGFGYRNAVMQVAI